MVILPLSTSTGLGDNIGLSRVKFRQAGNDEASAVPISYLDRRCRACIVKRAVDTGQKSVNLLFNTGARN